MDVNGVGLEVNTIGVEVDVTVGAKVNVVIGAEVNVVIGAEVNVATVVLTTELTGVGALVLEGVVDSSPLESEMLLPLEPVRDLLCLCVPPLVSASRASSILMTDRLISSCIISALPISSSTFSSSVTKFKISSSYLTNRADLSTSVRLSSLSFGASFFSNASSSCPMTQVTVPLWPALLALN